jgi:hypothetical protein
MGEDTPQNIPRRQHDNYEVQTTGRKKRKQIQKSQVLTQKT